MKLKGSFWSSQEVWLIVIFAGVLLLAPAFGYTYSPDIPQDPYINITLENKTICMDRIYGNYIDISVESNIYNTSKWTECRFIGAYQQEMLKPNVHESNLYKNGTGKWTAWVRNLSGNHSYLIMCPNGLVSNILQIKAVVC